MADSPLWVVVDDTSAEILYQGSWFPDVGSLDNVGPFGPPYRSTLHGTNSSTSLSFSFSGTAIMVAGTLRMKDTPNGLDPKWECFVDGVSIGSNPTLGTWPENNKNICGPTDSFADGPHKLTINVVSAGQTFWFDNIQYVPSKGAALDNQLVQLQSSYPGLKYGSAWTDLTTIGPQMKMTLQKGATFDYEFEGTSLEWYGAFPKDLPGQATTATYSVDTLEPVTFNLQGHPSNAPDNLYHIKLFETAKYPMGKHKLSVVYNGDSSTTPLVLYYLVVAQGSPPISSSNAPLSGSTSGLGSPTGTNLGSRPSSLDSNASSSGATKHNPSPGAIVGGILGGISFILCLIILAVLCRRRRRQRQNSGQDPHRRSTAHGTILPESDPILVPFGTPETRTSFNAGPTSVTSQTSSQNLSMIQHPASPIISSISQSSNEKHRRAEMPILYSPIGRSTPSLFMQGVPALDSTQLDRGSNWGTSSERTDLPPEYSG